MRARLGKYFFLTANHLDKISMWLNRIGLQLIWGK